jgi:Fic family protein
MKDLKKLLLKIDSQKKILDTHRPLSPSVLARLKEYFDLEWTYTSNAIEGSTLSRRETLLVLKHGLTVKGKQLKEHIEVINHKEAIDYVESLAKAKNKITEETVKYIQQLVTAKTIDVENTGEYRKEQIYIAGAEHIPPKENEIPKLMKAFIKWINTKESDKLHPIEKSAIAHYKFVYIHPFVDGNGRTARLIMNLLLMQKGYPIAIIREIDRGDYYDALSKADKGKPEPFILLVAEAVYRTMGKYLASIPV